MKRILLVIEYDGTNYCGWQRQPQFKTVQGEIEDAIFRTIGENVEIFGSGRTDAGVHGLHQTAHFDLNAPVPVCKLKEILNSALPADIAIKSVEEVDQDFHARFSIKKKTYLYKIYNGQEKNAFLANSVAWVRYPLDIDLMKEASKILVGEHDFRGYCSSNTNATSFVRTIYDIKVTRNDDFIYVEVCGNGFLYNMVRIIVGTLVDYARGKLTIDNVKNALDNGIRAESGQTMPPQGLYLKDTQY